MKDLPANALDLFLVEHLHVAPENPRSDEDVDPAVIEVLADNIEENGLLSPLIGYEHEFNAFITAGGRRLRALRLIEDRNGPAAGQKWPVHIMPYEEAVNAGHAEQLSHVAMSGVDELRVYTSSLYADRPAEWIARVTGRPLRYVQQRQEILRLPDPMVDAVLKSQLSIDQAIGLTLAKEYPETQADFFQRALRDPRFDQEDMRRALSQTVKGWHDTAYSQLVTQEEYREAGGRLQQDLFTGNPLVLDPAILLQLATEKARDVMKERFPNAAFIVEVEDGRYISDYKRHPGVFGLNEAEAAEWRNLGWWEMNQLEKAAQPDEETGEIDVEAEAAYAAAKARKEELAPRAKFEYPDDLKRLLGVVWKLVPYPTMNHGETREPIQVEENVLPWTQLEREALQNSPYAITSPSDAKADSKEPVKPEDKISNVLALNIERVKAHATRMELARIPDQVIRLFTSHLAARVGRTVGFSVDPDATQHPDPEIGVTFNAPWQAMEKLADLEPSKVLDLSDKETRQLLAYRILMCLTTRHPMCNQQTALIIRKHWTPTAAFLRSYNRAQLLVMLQQLKPGEDFSKQKASALVDIVAALAPKKSDWLPIGF